MNNPLFDDQYNPWDTDVQLNEDNDPISLARLTEQLLATQELWCQLPGVGQLMGQEFLEALLEVAE